MRLARLLSATAVTILLAGWTSAGQTFDPALAARELPLDVVQDCAPPGATGPCAVDFSSRWVGRGTQGDLFIVLGAPCTGADCPAWLVERHAGGAALLVRFAREFRFERGAHAYPVVVARQVLSSTEAQLNRFEWQDGRYVRTESKRFYHVDGVECGTREQCAQAASEALRERQVDRALRIWERVHGVSWI